MYCSTSTTASHVHRRWAWRQDDRLTRQEALGGAKLIELLFKKEAWDGSIKRTEVDLVIDKEISKKSTYVLEQGKLTDVRLSKHLRKESEKQLDKKPDKQDPRFTVWRPVTRYLDPEVSDDDRPTPRELSQPERDIVEAAALRVVLDYNQGFRHRRVEEDRQRILTPPFVIRAHDPRDWDVNLADDGPETRVWLLAAGDLDYRRVPHISSWKELARALRKTLEGSCDGTPASEWTQHVVIQVGTDGALWLGPGASEEGTPFYVKGSQPNAYKYEQSLETPGTATVFLHALADAVFAGGDLSVRLAEGIRAGLRRVRRMQIFGFPAAEQIEQNRSIPLNVRVFENDEFGEDWIDVRSMSEPARDVTEFDRAVEIIRKRGPKCDQNIELRPGALQIAQPEPANSILDLVVRLDDEVENAVPAEGKTFSFAIFGGPGSGKSFIAQRVQEAADAQGRLKRKTFNLSQLHDPADLIEKLDEVRTIGAQGRIPFVIWDEFDTALDGRRGAWLSRFLMPMQDNAYVSAFGEKQILGSCVFVFVGGTFPDGPTFQDWACAASEDGKLSEGAEMKGRDFHSRLASTFTVPPIDGSKDGDSWVAARAVVLGHLLREYAPQLFEDDSGNLKRDARDTSKPVIDVAVEQFLLRVPLRHGARSLEKIVKATTVHKPLHLSSLNLPPLNVLVENVRKDELDEPLTRDEFIDWVTRR